MKDESAPTESETLAPSVTTRSREENDLAFPGTDKDESDQDLIRLALHKSPFFTCLDDEQVERFIKVAELKTFSAGQSVILEGCLDDFDEEQDDADRQQDERNTLTTAELEARESQSGEQDETAITKEGFVLIEKSNFNIPSEPIENSEDNVSTTETSGGEASHDISDAQSGSMVSSAMKDLSDSQQSGGTNNILPTQADEETTDVPKKSIVMSSPDDPFSKDYLEPPPPKSGVPSYLYIIKTGQADVMYSQNIRPASLGRGTLFGEGGFLFGRQHSASVLAASGLLECYVVDAATFRNYVLPSENMKKMYTKHATPVDDKNTSPYMTMQDFVNSCLDQEGATSSKGGIGESDKVRSSDDGTEAEIQDPLAGVRIANTFNILRNKAQETSFSSQRISLADFCLFHLLMARPDPEVDITFLLIDERKRGVIYKEDVDRFLQSSFHDFNFDMESDFIGRHFGRKDDKIQLGIRPQQFSQFLVDLRQEIGQQVFLQEVEKHGTPEGGYLTPARFVQVLQKACGWRLPDGVVNRLESIYQSNDEELDDFSSSRAMNESPSIHEIHTVAWDMGKREMSRARYFSYSDFLAFQEVLTQLPGICNLIDRACEIKQGPVSADDFKVANRVLGMGGRLSRRQVEIIFGLFDLDGDGYVSQKDTVAVAGAEFAQRIDAVPGRQGALTFAPPPQFRHDAEKKDAQPKSFWVLLQNFSLTSMAGAIGVFALAPLDLVKTRMMNERISATGQRMYRNSLDCLTMAARSEGYFGLYRGLLPQLIGIAPEKAIKLTVNKLLQQSLVSDIDGSEKSGLHYLQEMLAGGCAGACQLLVSNPIEIVKIRMQLQGETARILKARGFLNPVPQSLTAVVKTLGYSGLFTGARACLLRDIPFGAIYFPTYSFLKENLSNREGPSRSVSASNLLLAGTLAGVPSSLLTTPADVIKTRLQVIPRPGEMKYDGIRDCFTKVYAREGPTAFFKGAGMRIARISPQFGISLVAYEQLSQLLGAQGLLSPTTVPVHPKDYFEAFPTRAIHNKTNDADPLLGNLGSNSLRPGSRQKENR